jgi:TPR repeat protein
VAAQITPSSSNYSLRFYESRDGMPKDIGQRFKDAIRETQRDLPAACTSFAAIDHDFPGHFAVRYDLGICAEAKGDYRAAMDWYRQAAAARPRDRADFDLGISRTQRLIDGAADRAMLNGTRAS